MIGQTTMTASVMEYLHKGDKTWTHFCDLPSPRAYFGASFHKNKIYIAGGKTMNPDNGQVEVSKDAMCLDLESKQFHKIESMDSPRAGCTSVILNNSLFVLGGNVNSEDAFGEFYDFEFEFWYSLPSIPLLVTSPCVAACERYIYVVGKFESKTYLQIYDPKTQKWEEQPRETPEWVDIQDGSAYYYDKKLFICNGKGCMNIYDFGFKQWRLRQNTLDNVKEFKIFEFQQNLYIAGGEFENGMLSNQYSLFDLPTLCWENKSREFKTFPVKGHSLVHIPFEEIFLLNMKIPQNEQK